MVCDLENDHYEYHERRGKELYPTEGSYPDLDRFKPVNDTYGHEVGDKLLQEVAKRLQSCIRNQDYALGGDEFALLTIGAISPEETRRKVEFICKTVAAPYNVAGSLLTIGTSCGFALYPEEGTDTDNTIRLADQRMYKHKQKNHALQDQGLYG